MDILILFLILEEILSFFFSIEKDVYCLYYVEVSFLYVHFLESFYHKWVLNVIKSYACIYWDDHIAFSIQFLNMRYYILLICINWRILEPLG